MIEYLRSDNSKMTIDYTTTKSLSAVTFEIYDLDTEEFVQTGNATLTASTGSVNASFTWSASLNEDSTSYDRNIKIEWVVSTASGASATIEYASMIRPFATVSRIRTLADISASEADATLQKQERKARYFLQNHTGIDFTKKYNSVVVYGNNTDILSLPIPVIRIDKIYEDDILIYDIDSSASYSAIDFGIEPSVSKTRIKIINTDTANDRSILEFPDMAIFPYDGVFKKDYQYKVLGIFGYEYVPSDIEQATALLVEDYLCNDFNIRNKNISKLSNDSYNMSYATDAATGTGNLLVDKLISRYMTQPRFMVI